MRSLVVAGWLPWDCRGDVRRDSSFWGRGISRVSGNWPIAVANALPMGESLRPSLTGLSGPVERDEVLQVVAFDSRFRKVFAGRNLAAAAIDGEALSERFVVGINAGDPDPRLTR